MGIPLPLHPVFEYSIKQRSLEEKVRPKSRRDRTGTGRDMRCRIDIHTVQEQEATRDVTGMSMPSTNIHRI